MAGYGAPHSAYGEWPTVPEHQGSSHAAAETEALLSHAIEETRARPQLPPRQPEWMRNRSEALAFAGFVQQNVSDTQVYAP